MVSYRLLRRLAVGGMAEVFLAKVLGADGFEKPVAIKRILPHLAADPAFSQQFVAEGRLTVTLQHANVVQVLDLGRSGGSLSMVLEFIDGDTLLAVLRAARLQERALEPREAAWIALQVAEGLAYAHARTDERGRPMNIVHRDVNPSNVMVSRSGEVKLSDFGIARASSVQSTTQTGVVKGKTGYFAPEQVRGAAADQRTDVFCLGILLAELLLGRRLFREKELPRAFAEVAAFRPEALPLQGLAPGLAGILRTALAINPQHRYPSARGFADSLSAWLFEDRQRVGTADVQRLFASLFPGRRSPLELPAELDAVVYLGGNEGAAALQELPPTLAAGGAPRRRLKPQEQRLADLVVAAGLLRPEQLASALEQHQVTPEASLEALLVDRGFLDEATLLPARASLHQVQVLDDRKLREVLPPTALLTRVSAEKAEQFKAVPIALTSGHRLLLAMANPEDLRAQDAFKFMTGVAAVTPVLATSAGIARTIARFFHGIPDVEASWGAMDSASITRFGASRWESSAELDVAELPTEGRLRERLIEAMLTQRDPSGGTVAAATLAGRLVARHPTLAPEAPERARLLTRVVCLSVLEGGAQPFRPPGGAAVRRMVGPLWDALEVDLEPVLLEGFGTVAPRTPVGEAVLAVMGLLYLARSPAPRGEAVTQALGALRETNLLSERTVGALASEVSSWQRTSGLLAVLALSPGGDVVSLQMKLLESGWRVLSPRPGELLSALAGASVLLADDASAPEGFAGLAQQVRQHGGGAELALLAVAANPEDPLVATAIDVGADDVLVRPLNTALVLSKLKRLPVAGPLPRPSAFEPNGAPVLTPTALERPRLAP